MHEQIPLHFEASNEPNFETMTIEELREKYREYIGISSRLCGNEREIILNALTHNPQDEIQRLRAIDTEDDKDELGRLYRR